MELQKTVNLDSLTDAQIKQLPIGQHVEAQGSPGEYLGCRLDARGQVRGVAVLWWGSVSPDKYQETRQNLMAWATRPLRKQPWRN